VSYIAPEAEFTPPVIYSRTARSKLVFLVEAKLDRPANGEGVRLHPGLPVDFRLAAAP
jgi:HlyD family secretion protein